MKSTSLDIESDSVNAYLKSINNVGSIEHQCVFLTKRIQNLTLHLVRHNKDHSSRRGLLMLVGRRRRFLSYLKGTSIDKYRQLIRVLGLRK